MNWEANEFLLNPLSLRNQEGTQEGRVHKGVATWHSGTKSGLSDSQVCPGAQEEEDEGLKLGL